MQDSFNLAWKVAHVLQGRADPKILETYEAERGQAAAALIAFDHKVNCFFLRRVAMVQRPD